MTPDISPALSIRSLDVTFGPFRALQDVSLDIRTGEAFGLVGESGSGKSTLLRAVAGLAPTTAGSIRMGAETLKPGKRSRAFHSRVQMVFQDPFGSLHPRQTIDRQLLEPLAIHGIGDGERRILKALDEVGLGAGFRFRYPHQLSGGQQGRVAIARALAADPPVLLMDEPFAAIDPVVRERLQDELLLLQQRLRKTIVLVTHDINEAIRLGDRIAIFQEGGELAQFATPDHILSHPASDFVRRFIGPEPNLQRLGRIQVGQLPRHDVPLIDESLSPIASPHPPVASPLRLVLDKKRRPLNWFDPVKRRTLPVDAPLAAINTLRFAYSALLDAPGGVVVHVDADGEYQGSISHALLQNVLEGHVDLRRYD